MAKNRLIKTAIIFAGGQGTRMKTLTKGRINKVNIELHKRPFISHLLEMLKNLGINEIILVVRPEEINQFANLIKEKKYPDLKYVLIETPNKTPNHTTNSMIKTTATEYEIVRKRILSGLTLVLFGDTYYAQKFLERAISYANMNKKTTIILSPITRQTTQINNHFHEKTVTEARIFENPLIYGIISQPYFFNLLMESDITTALKIAAEKRRVAIIYGQAMNVNSPDQFRRVKNLTRGKTPAKRFAQQRKPRL